MDCFLLEAFFFANLGLTRNEAFVIISRPSGGAYGYLVKTIKGCLVKKGTPFFTFDYYRLGGADKAWRVL